MVDRVGGRQQAERATRPDIHHAAHLAGIGAVSSARSRDLALAQNGHGGGPPWGARSALARLLVQRGVRVLALLAVAGLGRSFR